MSMCRHPGRNEALHLPSGYITLAVGVGDRQCVPALHRTPSGSGGRPSPPFVGSGGHAQAYTNRRKRTILTKSSGGP
jgi:hypothetical protein